MMRSLILCCVLVWPASGLDRPLVFVANVSGNWDLFLLPANVSTPVQLTTTPLDERAPSLSSDRKSVVYATSDGALWVLDLASRQPKRLELPPGIYGNPFWLPDGSGIVYTSYEYAPPLEDADLFLYRFAGNEAKPLVTQTGPQDHPVLAPDGDRLAYVSSIATTVSGFGSTVTQHIWLVSLRDGKPSPVLTGGFRDTQPAWSDDGKTLAFSSDRTGTPEIWIAGADLQSPMRLTSGAGAKFHPAWSADGTAIVFVSASSAGSQLEIVDVKSRRVRRLLLFENESVEVRDPDW